MGNIVYLNSICKVDLGFFVLIDDLFKCDNNYFVLKSKIGNFMYLYIFNIYIEYK